MKKLLIPAFACAAMLTACGDDSSSANDAAESSSSVAAESSSSVVAESSSSDWAHEGVGVFACFSASDSTTGLKYSFEGPDSAMEVARYIYPKLSEDVDKVCEEAKANKTDDQEVTCDQRVEISNKPKTMTFDAFKALMTEECYNGIAINLVHMTDPDKAPENTSNENLDFEDLLSVYWYMCEFEYTLRFVACPTYCNLVNGSSGLPVCTEEFEHCIHEQDLPECSGAFTTHF